MPASQGRGTCSPRRIIDPFAAHYFVVLPACFAFLVWRFCLRVFAGTFFLLLLPPLSLVAIWRLPSRLSLIVVSWTVCGKDIKPSQCLGCGTCSGLDLRAAGHPN